MKTTSLIRTAIVTGSSRGIGREVALRLAAEGHAVVVNYAGNADLAEQVVRTITDKGGQAIAVRADVADEVAVAAMFDAAEQHFGGIDVVVNSAGRMVLGPLAELDLDALDAMHRRRKTRYTFSKFSLQRFTIMYLSSSGFTSINSGGLTGVAITAPPRSYFRMCRPHVRPSGAGCAMASFGRPEIQFTCKAQQE